MKEFFRRMFWSIMTVVTFIGFPLYFVAVVPFFKRKWSDMGSEAMGPELKAMCACGWITLALVAGGLIHWLHK